MKAKDVKRTKQKQLKTVQVNLRITPKLSKWLYENEFSPTAIFNVACEELGFKEA